MTVATVIFLFLTGALGGALNAIAGGAMLFTFPALILIGLPPIVANASNHLALLPGNAAALPAYRQELRKVGRALFPILLVSGFGAVAGSLLLLATSEAVFTALVPLLIMLATGLFAFGASARALIVSYLTSGTASGLFYVVLFMASVYGGYFGAGLGIVMLAIVQIMGYASFHEANAIKNAVLVFLTVLSLMVFGAGGIIALPEALVMMSGAVVGGYLAGHWSRRLDERPIRIGVTAFGAVLSAIYVWRFWLP